MNNIKISENKQNTIKIIFIGFILIGIGLIIWALINIGTQSAGYSKTIDEPSARQTVLTEKSSNTATDLNLYPVYPSTGDNIGTLTFPALKQSMAIFQGTATDQLKKGVGHYLQSVLPGEKDNCVLSGHRDTVFTKLGKLKLGDQMIVKTSAGTFTYVIKRIRIVDKNDRTVIVPTDHAVLTVTTCYPFIYIGNAPQRYILVGDLIVNK